MAKREFYVVITKDEDGYFIGEVTQIKSCFNQGETLEELMKNMCETIKYCLEENGTYDQSEFVGVQKISVASGTTARAQREFHVVITKDENGCFRGVAPQLRECYGHGKTQVELMKNMRKAIELGIKDDDLEDCSIFLEVQMVEM